MSKVWYRSKTILFSLVLALIGLADALGAVDIRPVLLVLGVPPEKTEGVVLMLSIVFTFLRIVSTGAVSARKGDRP